MLTYFFITRFQYLAILNVSLLFSLEVPPVTTNLLSNSVYDWCDIARPKHYVGVSTLPANFKKFTHRLITMVLLDCSSLSLLQPRYCLVTYSFPNMHQGKF